MLKKLINALSPTGNKQHRELLAALNLLTEAVKENSDLLRANIETDTDEPQPDKPEYL